MPDLRGTIMMVCRLSWKRWPHECKKYIIYAVHAFSFLFSNFGKRHHSTITLAIIELTMYVVQADLEVMEILLPLLVSVGVKGVLTSGYAVHFYLCSNSTDLTAIY